MLNLLMLIDKLAPLLVFLPPLYLAYRFIRWYWKQAQEPETT